MPNTYAATNTKKFLDANGLAHFAQKLNEYPTNDVIAAVIDGVQDALDEKVDKDKVGVANGVASLGSDGKVPSSQLPPETEYAFDQTYNASTNKIATVKTVTNAIQALDGGTIGTPGTNKTITALSQTDGKVSATFGNISITKSQVSDFPTLGTAAAKNAATSIANGSTSEELPTSSAVAAFVEGKGYKTTDNNTTYTLTQDTTDGHKIIFTPSNDDPTTITIPDNNTDTKVTSAANHYTPSRDSSADKTASASGATAAWNIDVVKGVTLQTDGKGHVTGLTVTSGKIPANPDTNTHRPIQMNGTQILGDNTTALNLKAGNNVSLSNSSGTVTINATDTKYESKAAASGGIDVSLVTTGEKAIWNAKTSNVGTITGITMNGNTMGSAGVVDLGTVITAHQDISGKMNANLKGANNGVAELDENGKVPTAQLPSYVDDVLEYSTRDNFPLTGETGKIYINLADNKTYRWSGSTYVEISPSLALGTTSSTAFRGDYGNAAYSHATAKGSAYAAGLYKITTNAEGHVTNATAVQKADITALGIPSTNTTYTFDGTYNASTNKAATENTVKTAIGNLDGNLNNTTPGAGKTLTAFSQEDGIVSATFGNISITKSQVSDLGTIGAAAAKGVDTSIAAASTSISLPTSQAVAAFVEGKGYKTTDNNTWDPLVGASSTANGTAGYVAAPQKGYQDAYLRGDATWVKPATAATQGDLRPITSDAVYTILGNIEALLAEI